MELVQSNKNMGTKLRTLWKLINTVIQEIVTLQSVVLGVSLTPCNIITISFAVITIRVHTVFCKYISGERFHVLITIYPF